MNSTPDPTNRPAANPGGADRKAAWILAAIAGIEGLWVALNAIANGAGFVRYLGFASGRGGAWPGWLAAAIVTALFLALGWRLPSVRANFVRPSWLKVLGLAVAVAAGILEEVTFRKWVMDWAQSQGSGKLLQILASALAFGAIHGVWGLMGRSLRAAIGATLATGILGAGLGVVYLTAGRSLAPCIVSHFLINALLEPGLVLAATRGEMGRRPVL